jgi:nucleoid-associated protein YgaU
MHSMGLLDKIKDVLTTDNEERAAKAKEIADEAKRQADEARKKAEDAQRQANDLAVKAGLPVNDPAADAAAAEEKRKADEAAATLAAEAAAAEEEARQVQAEHDAHVAEEAAKAKAAADAKAASVAVAAAAAAKAKVAAAAPKPLRIYTVVKGDTLSAIGHKYGVDWREIAKLNNLKNPDLIHPGEVFKIPND